MLGVHGPRWFLLHDHVLEPEADPRRFQGRLYKPAGATSSDTDLIVDPPGPGKNTAFGHVVLDFLTGVGTLTISGGTGKFTKFHASVDVSYLGGVNWAWDGTYSFGKD